MDTQKQWARVNAPDAYHVLPVDDLKSHEDGFHCWCEPSVEHFQNGVLVVHNAADGREFFEKEEPQGH